MQDVDERMKSVAKHHGRRLQYDSRGSNDVHSQPWSNPRLNFLDSNPTSQPDYIGFEQLW